jgi:hypothetical protein
VEGEVLALFEVISRYLRELRNAVKSPQDVQYQELDLNPGPPRYETGMPPTGPQRSLTPNIVHFSIIIILYLPVQIPGLGRICDVRYEVRVHNRLSHHFASKLYRDMPASEWLGEYSTIQVNQGSISGRVRGLCTSWAHPASCPVVPGALYSGVKRHDR